MSLLSLEAKKKSKTREQKVEYTIWNGKMEKNLIFTLQKIEK